MAEIPDLAATSNGMAGSRQPEEARVCRCVRASMRKVGLGSFYNYLWSVKKTKPASLPPSPRERRRATRQLRPTSRREQALLPYLSRLNGHDTHSGCFETHLIDAIKLNTFLNQ